MKRLSISLVVIALFLSVPRFSFASVVMPQELVKVAEENGCSEVTDFYSLPGQVIHPPFVYGPDPSDENHAVFWCQNIKTKCYVLAQVTRKEWSSKWQFEKIIELHEGNTPGGLYFSKDSGGDTLDNFYFIDTEKPGPKVRFPKGVFIYSENSGTERVFIKYKNRWMISSRC